MEYHLFSVNDFIQDEFFQRWVLSPGEEHNRFWNDFLKQYPQQQQTIKEATHFLSVLHFQEEDIFESRISNLKKKIDYAIDMQEEDRGRNQIPFLTPDIATQGPRGKSSLAYFAAAASIAVGLLAGGMLLFKFTPYNTDAKQVLYQQEQVTPKGKRIVITLDDGTRVWLNADSRLSYPKTFSGQSSREVYLEGEGFFDVAEDKNKPFILHTSDIDINVVGTAFNVRSYEQDQAISTTLVRGKVRIETTGDQPKQITLAPSQQAVFDKESKKIVLQNQINTEAYTSWKEGKLVFYDQSLLEIVEELERWYNVTIDVQDKASLRCRFSANVNNKTLTEVLELFKASDGIDYHMDGSRIVIVGTLCEE